MLGRTTSGRIPVGCPAVYKKIQNLGLEVVAYSKEGQTSDRKSKTNQDSFLIHEGLAGDQNTITFGVFDGHGPWGERVSGTASHHFAQILARNVAVSGALSEDVLTSTFHEVHRLVMNNREGYDANLSGCTANVVVKEGGKLWCANAGDSRAMIVGIDNVTNQLYVKALAQDHTPEVPEEKKRILSEGGRIDRIMIGGEEQGPLRVYKWGINLPGLTVTRAIGDGLGQEVGITFKPEIRTFEVAPTDKYLILCSDGISEFMDDKEIAYFVHSRVLSKAPLHTLAQVLVSEARRRWTSYEGGMIDDCTAVVVYLNQSTSRGFLSRGNSLQTGSFLERLGSTGSDSGSRPRSGLSVKAGLTALLSKSRSKLAGRSVADMSKLPAVVNASGPGLQQQQEKETDGDNIVAPVPPSRDSNSALRRSLDYSSLSQSNVSPPPESPASNLRRSLDYAALKASTASRTQSVTPGGSARQRLSVEIPNQPGTPTPSTSGNGSKPSASSGSLTVRTSSTPATGSLSIVDRAQSASISPVGKKPGPGVVSPLQSPTPRGSQLSRLGKPTVSPQNSSKALQAGPTISSTNSSRALDPTPSRTHTASPLASGASFRKSLLKSDPAQSRLGGRSAAPPTPNVTGGGVTGRLPSTTQQQQNQQASGTGGQNGPGNIRMRNQRASYH